MSKRDREEYTARVVEFFLCAAKSNGAFNSSPDEVVLYDTLLDSITDEMLADGREVAKEFILELSIQIGFLFRHFVKASGSDPEAAAKIFALYLREEALK